MSPSYEISYTWILPYVLNVRKWFYPCMYNINNVSRLHLGIIGHFLCATVFFSRMRWRYVFCTKCTLSVCYIYDCNWKAFWFMTFSTCLSVFCTLIKTKLCLFLPPLAIKSIGIVPLQLVQRKWCERTPKRTFNRRKAIFRCPDPVSATLSSSYSKTTSLI